MRVNIGRLVAEMDKFCAVGPHVCRSSLWITSCHPSGAHSIEGAPRFRKSSCTRIIIYKYLCIKCEFWGFYCIYGLLNTAVGTQL